MLEAAAALERQQKPSDFAKRLRERVDLALLRSDFDDSSMSSQTVMMVKC